MKTINIINSWGEARTTRIKMRDLRKRKTNLRRVIIILRIRATTKSVWDTIIFKLNVRTP